MPLPGGGPFNVARGVARLGVPCAFLGAISSDRFGTLLRRTLLDDGVQTTTVLDTDCPTTIGVADVDEQGHAQYSFYLDGTAAMTLTATAALRLLRGVEPRALHVGTLGLAAEPIGDAVEQVVMAVEDEVMVMLDPNWRPRALEDLRPWRERLERVLTRADLVKVSVEDLEHLAPSVSPREAAASLLEGHPRCVLVTDGESDVLVLTSEGEAVVAPPKVDVVDTIGAGDAFCAGVHAWCAINEVSRAALGSLRLMSEAARFGALVAARTSQRAGADPPSLDEVAEAIIAPLDVGA